MSKPNKDGWIRHRGGKCPVDGDVVVEIRCRYGCTQIYAANGFAWDELGEGQIMAYRIHKPAEQPAPVIEPVERKCEGRACEMPDAESHSKECLLDAAIDQGWAGPLQWRDRITEIDHTVETLEEERVSLVQRLEGEGFRLIDANKSGNGDMSDWRNWQDGDLVICVALPETCASLKLGKVYVIESDFGGLGVVDDDGDIMNYPVQCGPYLKFHFRPSK